MSTASKTHPQAVPHVFQFGDCLSGLRQHRKSDLLLQGNSVVQGRHSRQRLFDGGGFAPLDEVDRFGREVSHIVSLSFSIDTTRNSGVLGLV
jgi:hypothetical protein